MERHRFDIDRQNSEKLFSAQVLHQETFEHCDDPKVIKQVETSLPFQVNN